MNDPIVYLWVFILMFFVIILFYITYKFDSKKMVSDKIYKSTFFYMFLFMYITYVLFQSYYFTNYAILYLFFSIFVLISFFFWFNSSYKYGLLKWNIYFFIPVLLILITLVNFTKDSLFSIIITFFLLIAFYLWITISGLHIVLSKMNNEVKDSFLKKLFKWKEKSIVVIEYVVPYIVWTVLLILVLYVLKNVFDIYSLVAYSKEAALR